MEGKRLTRKQKESNDFEWYKKHIDKYSIRDNNYLLDFIDESTNTSKFRMKINYDLFNNKLNLKDFESVCYPMGKEVGKLPVDLTNKDIVSGKIKALLGMEMRRPFSWTILAVNEEATTRKEEEEFGQIKQFVINSITEPIRQQIEMEQQQQTKGRELTEEEQQQIQQQIEEELKARTPDEVKLYMEREHQDPAEILGLQIMRYLMEKEDISNKFNIAWKHGLISGHEIIRVLVENKEPVVKIINPLYFSCGKFDHFIEDAEWASYDEFLSISEIVNRFSEDLTDKMIDDLYEQIPQGNELVDIFQEYDSDFQAEERIRVTHSEWKSLKPLKFLSGIDLETGEPYEMLVDEEYKLNKEAGDIKIDTIWVIARYEGYKIGKDTYVQMREVPGQYFDIELPFKSKLSYIGCFYDAMNSEPTSLMDRIKFYQYMYDIILYKIELLMASDKGKILGIDYSMIPTKSAKLSMEQWFHYTFINQLALLNPNEDGIRKGDIVNSSKVLDLSLISDIKKYVELADYIERRCGESVGITKHIEGQIGSNEAVRNTQQAIIQSANILEPYFEMHNIVKRNVLQNLIEVAKVAYATYQPKYLSYVLDDLSRQLLQIDYDLLENSVYGIFVTNSMRSDEALQMVRQLSHAAMQNQAVEMSDVMKIMRSSSITEAEEYLRAAEKERREREEKLQEQQAQQAKELQQAQQDFEKEKMYMGHQFNMEEIEKKGEIEIHKQTILSIGFNEDKDLDKDGVPDVLEVAKFGVEAQVKQRALDIEESKLKQKEKEMANKKEIEEKKLKIEDKKAQSQVLKARTKA